MFTTDWLAQVQARLNGDAELHVIGEWFTVAVSLSCGDERCILRFERGRLIQTVTAPRLDVPCAFGFRASPEIWTRFFSAPQPLYHDIFAMLMRVPGFVLEGDTLVAMQHARALHRAMRVLRTVPPEKSTEAAETTLPPPPPFAPGTMDVSEASRRVHIEPIIGRYLNIDVSGVSCRIYVEEAGSGVPLLCLHTAGADSRQYRHVMTDPDVISRYRVIAFDMPYHGRSNPPDRWWLTKYRLTTAQYLATIRAVWLALDLDRPVVMGCSIGGAIVLALAVEYQRELRGIIALESSAFAPGRYNEFLHHPAIHGGELGATYTYALCAPQSPESSTRENWWVYSQAGPGVYAGDVHFYSLDWDGRQAITRIDTRVCKVSLLTGEYDYSCTPEMTRQVAAAIPGSRLVIMPGMGHFPMIENYPGFRPYLLPELALMRDDSAR